MAIEKQKSLSLSLCLSRSEILFLVLSHFMPATKASLKKQTKMEKKEKNHKQVMNVDRGEGTHKQHHSVEETEHVELDAFGFIFCVCAS